MSEFKTNRVGRMYFNQELTAPECLEYFMREFTRKVVKNKRIAELGETITITMKPKTRSSKSCRHIIAEYTYKEKDNEKE